jgi:hypothetical protein
MKINDWFNNGCNYEEGVAMYATLKEAKPNLLQLFKRKKTNAFADKLKYELSKYKDSETSFTPLIASVKKPIIKPDTVIEEKPKYKNVLISDFPVVLHPVFIKQKNDFATACSLKIQLNALPAEDEEKALEICLQIDALFDAVELAWKQLDHFTDTKTVLEIKENDFEKLSPAQLILRRNNKRTVLTKTKKRLEVLLLQTPNTIKTTTKQEITIEKQKTKFAQLEKDIADLTFLINKKD